MNRSSEVRHSAHYQQREKDFEEINKLIKMLPEDRFRFTFFRDQNSAPFKYLVQAKIRSVMRITGYGAPYYINQLDLEIFLPFHYPEKAQPRMRIDPPLFHPHVRLPIPVISDRLGSWIDPRSNQGGLGGFLLWALHSLVYQPAYILPDAAEIGNREALAWFRYWESAFKNYQVQGLFPTDPIQLPEIRAFTPKTFEVEGEKRFEVSAARPERMVIASGKSFQILETRPPYQPELAEIPAFRTSLQSNFRGSSQVHKVYLKPNAAEHIFEHIGWGKETSDNRVEQGGILVGRVIQDEQQSFIGIVEEAIPGRFAKGNSAYLEMDHETWKNMYDQADRILDARPEERLQIIGWYHTHPKGLDVFMSTTDLDTQQQTFANDWQFAIVLNPQKKTWRAFRGKEAQECLGFLVAAEQ